MTVSAPFRDLLAAGFLAVIEFRPDGMLRPLGPGGRHPGMLRSRGRIERPLRSVRAGVGGSQSADLGGTSKRARASGNCRLAVHAAADELAGEPVLMPGVRRRRR